MKQLLSGRDWLVSHFLPNEVNNTLGYMPQIYSALLGLEMQQTGSADSEVFNRLEMEAGKLYGASFIPATVPGDVQSDALDAGLIEDINVGYNARAAEWTSQRDWLYLKRFTPIAAPCKRVRLCLDGVDDACEVYFNGEWLGNHQIPWIPFSFDITDKIKPGQDNVVMVLVRYAPDAECQWGASTKVRHLKPRFAYAWDWCTRLVPLGIWRDVYIAYDQDATITDLHVTSDVDYKNRKAVVYARVAVEGKQDGCTATFTLHHPCNCTETKTAAVNNGEAVVEFTVDEAALWYPNGYGRQPLYNVSVVIGENWDDRNVNIGLRHMEWKRTEGAPADALPYQPYVNGLRVYMQGYNVVPIRQLYGRMHEDAYERRLALARDCGVTFLRVWGAGLLEREIFYDLCDRYGILVMQELFQSSSNQNNHPPRDREYIDMLVKAAESAIVQKRNHPSLAVWCGGNELCFRKEMGYMDARGNILIAGVEDMEGYNSPAVGHWVPLDAEYPTLAALREVVYRLDPGRMWFHTSGSGPVTQNAGLQFVGGDMHDVHGPWTLLGPTELYTHYNLYDMMLHAEFGFPGTGSVQTIEKVIPEKFLWPLDDTNPMVHYHGRMWCGIYKQMKPYFAQSVQDHRTFILASRFMQWEQMRYALEAHRRLGRRCAGACLWHMAEPWPNFADTCSIDAYDQPKPAFYGTKTAFRLLHIAARYASVIHKDVFEADISLFNSTSTAFSGRIAAQLYAMDGTLLGEICGDCSAGPDSVVAEALPVRFDNLPNGVFFLRQTLLDENGAVMDRGYSVHSTMDVPYLPLLSQPECAIGAKLEADRLILRNNGTAVVSALTVECENTGSILFSDGCMMLLPGEEACITLDHADQKVGKLFISGFGVPYRELTV